MIILSKYAVLEYLLWIKNNKYKIQETENEVFYGIISTENIMSTQVFDISISTRNSVFEFLVENNWYIFKQFGPDLVKKKKYFASEATILNQQYNYIPKIAFQDNLNNVIISEKLIGYKDFGFNIGILFQKYKDAKIKLLLVKLAEKLKEIHSISSISGNIQTPKYNNSLWRHFFIDKPEFELLYPEFMTLWKDSCLVHYDLNSSNILLSETEDLKIIDWEMSEIGDPYYDLCSIIRMLYLVLIGPFFLNAKLPFNFKEMKKFVDFFLSKYGSAEKNKLLNLFKIHNHDLYNKEYYFKNIEILLS